MKLTPILNLQMLHTYLQCVIVAFSYVSYLIENLHFLPRRCDKLLFMSTVADDTIGSIAVPNITNGRASLWNKTKQVQHHKPRICQMQGNFCKYCPYLFVPK